MITITGHNTLTSSPGDRYKPPFADQAAQKAFKAKIPWLEELLTNPQNILPISTPAHCHEFKRLVCEVKTPNPEDAVVYKSIQARSDGILEKLVSKVAQHFSLFARINACIYRYKEPIANNYSFIQEKISNPVLGKMTPEQLSQIPMPVLAKGTLANYILGMQDANSGNVIIDGDLSTPETWDVKFIDNVRSLITSHDLIWFRQGIRFYTQPAFRFGLLGVPETGNKMTLEACDQIRHWIETMEKELPALKTYLESPKLHQKMALAPAGTSLELIYKTLEERVRNIKVAANEQPQFSLRELFCKACPAFKRHVGMEAARFMAQKIKFPEESLKGEFPALTPIDNAFATSGKNTLSFLLRNLPKTCNLTEIDRLAEDHSLSLDQYFEKIHSTITQGSVNDTKKDAAYFDDSIYRAIPFTGDHSDSQALENLREFFVAQIPNLMQISARDPDRLNKIPPLELIFVDINGFAHPFHFYFRDLAGKMHSIQLDFKHHPGQVKILDDAGPFVKGSILTIKELQHQFLVWTQLQQMGFVEMVENSELPELGFKFEKHPAHVFPILNLYFHYKGTLLHHKVDYRSIPGKIILLNETKKETTIANFKTLFYVGIAKSHLFDQGFCAAKSRTPEELLLESTESELPLFYLDAQNVHTAVGGVSLIANYKAQLGFFKLTDQEELLTAQELKLQIGKQGKNIQPEAIPQLT